MYKTLLIAFPSDVAKYCIMPYLLPNISVAKDKYDEVLEELQAQCFEVFNSYRENYDYTRFTNHMRYYKRYEGNRELCKAITNPKEDISFSRCHFFLRDQERREEINKQLNAIKKIMLKLELFGRDRTDEYFATNYFKHLKLHKNFFKRIC